MKNLFLSFFSFFVGFVSVVHAQIGSFYSTDKDISSSLINSIYQDRRGYIWIATEDGLNKFDGVKFTVYKSHPGDSATIKNNYVRSLFEDSFGRFWVGCINGLHLYDRATDRFSEVQLYNNGVLISPHITHIIESKDHEIWISTSEHGIIRINGESAGIYQTDIQLSSRLSSMYLSYVFQDSKGVFWIASENQGLNRYDPHTDEVTVFKAPLQIGSNQISAVCEDAQGNIFVGTLTNGLYKYDTYAGVFQLVPHISRIVLSIKSLLVDDNNRLWVGTDGQGMKIYDEDTMCLDDYQMLSTSFDFSKMKVHAICQDRFGNLWTGLFQKGVFVDPETPNRFDYWGYKSFHQNIIGSGCIMSLLKDKADALWLGTDNDGVYRLKHGDAYHFKPAGGASVPNTVMAMIEDDAGNIWLGSYLSGLACLNKQTGRCTYFNNDIGTLDGNSAKNKIFCLAKDTHDQLWIGTNGAGVYIFDLKEKKYIAHYSQSHTRARQIPNNWINSIFCDHLGTIWIGSYNGICSVDAATGQVDTYSNNILPGNVVYCITEDSKHNLWIGTTEGLVYWDKQSAESTIYTIINGLSSNVVCGILEDENGNIWLSTHSGISKLLVDEGRFVNYYEFDGLQGNEFSMGAAFKSQDGKIFFGGTGGVSAFYPSEITDRHIPLNVYLTGLYILDQPVVAGKKSGRHEIFNKFIADVDTIYLSHKDNMFALEFSTFDFGSAKRVYYRYMMEGLNSQWMNTEQGVSRINFTNINHGTYQLRIKACIFDNSSEEKIITLVIAPPWFLTGWAKLFYTILFIIVVWGITWFIKDKIRQKNELMRREHAEQISEAKLQFFINISHEIRTPMTLIISPLEKLIESGQQDENQKVYMLMYRNAQRILRLINQMMDVRKIDKGLMAVKFQETDIVEFIEDLMQTFEYQSNKRNIRFEFVHEDSHLKVWVDLNNFDKVLVNILSNAFKFTPDNGEITVLLKERRDETSQEPLRHFFEIIVADTGSGIEESKIEKIFERFYQINSGNPEVNFGTGIGLHLARSLVELQYGTLYARNRSGGGSEFIIRLPMGCAHLSDMEREQKTDIPLVQKMHNQFPAELYHEDIKIFDKKSKSKTNYRILIVDDEDEIRQYLCAELSNTYKVYEAVNGKRAMEIILQEKPDLVVSDVMMPEMDGITLCKKLKSNINVNHIPVVLLTAKATDEDKAEGFDTGADAYISKPFNIELLKRVIAGVIDNRERLKQKASDSNDNKALIEPVVLRSSDQRLYEKVIKIVNENIANPDLNVETLASGTGMSRVHMHRKLKEITGQSARDFIRSIRLKQAADLLSNQKLTISEVAYSLGFSNLSHFSNSFREFYGRSPKEYAEHNRKEN